MKGSLAIRGPAAAPASLSFSGTNVSTSAYTQFIASLSKPCSAVSIINTSASPIIVALGASGSEINTYIVAEAGAVPFPDLIPWNILPGTRISLKALVATANTGSFTMNFFT